MPINYKDYPDNWKEIRKVILSRAGRECELCGAREYAKPVSYTHLTLPTN